MANRDGRASDLIWRIWDEHRATSCPICGVLDKDGGTSDKDRGNSCLICGVLDKDGAASCLICGNSDKDRGTSRQLPGVQGAKRALPMSRSRQFVWRIPGSETISLRPDA